VSEVRSLPNGELFRVPDAGEENNARRVAPQSGVAGLYQCPSCGLNCTSGAALSAHIGYDHRPAVAGVEMPDGTMIPTEMMSEEIGKANQRANAAEATVEAMTIELQNSMTRMAELEESVSAMQKATKGKKK